MPTERMFYTRWWTQIQSRRGWPGRDSCQLCSTRHGRCVHEYVRGRHTQVRCTAINVDDFSRRLRGVLDRTYQRHACSSDHRLSYARQTQRKHSQRRSTYFCHFFLSLVSETVTCMIDTSRDYRLSLTGVEIKQAKCCDSFLRFCTFKCMHTTYRPTRSSCSCRRRRIKSHKKLYIAFLF